MIQLKTITLKEFLSHDFTVVNINEGDKILLSGMSGAGKSSIIDAIIFCFYGKGRAENNKGLIRLGKKEAEVEVLLQSDDILYNIKRTVTIKGKQSLEITQAEVSKGEPIFTPLPSVGLKDSQAWLETSLLKSSYLLFINSIAYTQDGTENFVKQTAAKRKELLLEIVNTEDFDLYYNRAKTELANTSEKIIRIKAEIKGFQDTLDITKSSTEKVDKFELDLKQLTDDSKAVEELIIKLRLEKEEFSTKTRVLRDLETRINEGKAELKELNEEARLKVLFINKLKEIDVASLEKDVAKLKILEENKRQLDQTIEKDRLIQSQLNSLIANKKGVIDYTKEREDISDKLMELMLSPGSFCETIGRDCPKLEEGKKAEILSLENRASKIDAEVEESKRDQELYEAKKIELESQLSMIPSTITTSLNQEINLLKKSETELAVVSIKKDRQIELEKELILFEEKIDKCKLKIRNLEESLSKELSGFDQTTLYSLINSITEEETNLNNINIKINKINYELGYERKSKKLFEEATINKEIKDKEMNELSIRERRLSLVKEAFGGKGLKNIIIDYVLPRLESKINMILGKLSDFTVSLDTQKTGSDGESIIEGLFINIFNDKGEQLEFNSYSGGERNKIQYSIFEALSSFQRCNFRLLDESISGLHADHADKFADVMLHLDKKDAQVICISHIDLIKDKFEKQITIVKNNNISQIYDKKD